MSYFIFACSLGRLPTMIHVCFDTKSFRRVYFPPQETFVNNSKIELHKFQTFFPLFLFVFSPSWQAKQKLLFNKLICLIFRKQIFVNFLIL